MRWNEEPPTSTPAPRGDARPGLPTEEMRQMAAAAAELRRRTQPRPAGRPRPATTGQLPVARVRATPPIPTGTGARPVPRQQPVPRPEAAPPEPDRRRLRVEPPRTAPLPVPLPAPAARTAPPAPPVVDDPPAVARRRRRPGRSLFAVAAVLGLLTVSALPSIAAADAPPAGIHEDDDVQQYAVGRVDAAGATMDGVSGDLPVSAPTWVVPLKAVLRDGFGPRPEQPVPGVSLFHRGQDIGGPCGAPIRAAAAGVVESAGWWGTYGNWTLIAHGGGIETGYAHQERILVHVGEHVSAGQVIGLEGTTGASTGCHLHLEVHIDGVAVNPVPFFAAKGIPLGP